MKYALRIDQHETAIYESDGTLIDYYKEVTVRTRSGREKTWKVGLKILDNEEMFDEFRRSQIDPWVTGNHRKGNGHG